MRKTKELPPIQTLRKSFRYDPETGVLERLKRGAWSPCASNQTCPHPQVWVLGKNYLLHRLIWLIATGSEPLGEVDHIDGDSQNNRIDNLRISSSSQNNMNRRISTRNKSGVKGVFWVSKHRKWRAVLTVCGRQKVLGHYTDLGEAARIVADARQEMHGDFARHA